MTAFLMRFLTGLVAITLLATPARADAVEDFYKGKNVSVVIGFSAGGGYDLYGRLLARHMGKYIPGNPTLVPQNMPGAGSLRAAKYLFEIAPKDGTAFGIFSRSMPLGPVVGLQGATFDSRQFTWLGSMAKDVTLCITSDRSGVKTWNDMLKTDLTIGGEGKGADPDIFASVVKNVFNAKVRLATGFPGTADIMLAVERGELGGLCGVSYSSVMGRWGGQAQQGKLHIIVQGGLEKHPQLPNVPNMLDLAANEHDKTLMKLILAPQAMARPFAAPPGIPADRAQALRTAFAAVMKDAAFLDEVKRMQIEAALMPAEEIQRLLEDLYRTPNDLAAEVARHFGL